MTTDNWILLRPHLMYKMLTQHAVQGYQLCCLCNTHLAVVKCLSCPSTHGASICGGCDIEVHTCRSLFHDRVHMVDGFFQPLTPTTTVFVSRLDDGVVTQTAEFAAHLPYDRPCPNPECEWHQQSGSMELVGEPSTRDTITFLTTRGSFVLCAAMFRCRHCWSSVEQISPAHGTNNRFWPASPCKANIHISEDLLLSIMALQGAKPSIGLQVIVEALNVLGASLRCAERVDARDISQALAEYQRMMFDLRDIMGQRVFECPACFATGHEAGLAARPSCSIDANMKLIRFGDLGWVRGCEGARQRQE